MDKRKKIVLSVVLTVIIISTIFYLFASGFDIFYTKIQIKYPDGCIELYKGDELTTPICERGRMLMEKENNISDMYNIGQWNINPID